MRNIIKYLMVSLLTIGPVQICLGSPRSLFKSVPSHIFYVDQNNAICPIVGVKSASSVIIRLPDKTTETVRFKGVQWSEKELPPVGRITLGEVESTSLAETRIDENFVTGFGESVINFEIVADRSIPDCYVAIVHTFANGQKQIAFGKIGDLKAGDFRNHAVVFPNIVVPENTHYQYEFFSQGLPIEMYPLDRVATNLASHSLLIPWEKRLGQYIYSASINGSNRQPLLFARSFQSLDIASIKERNVQRIKVDLLIKTDGSGELISADDQLTGEEKVYLAQDIAKWQFFPSTKDGKPFEQKVTVPMQF